MATITSIHPGPTATATFNSISSGNVVLTSATCTNGATLTTTQPWAGWVDATTATTLRVPLEAISSVV